MDSLVTLKRFMIMRVFATYLFACSLFGQGNFPITTTSNGSATFFPISPSDRGDDILAQFNIFISSPFKTDRSQIALQTTRNGLIPNIQSITPMTNSTILLVKYLLPSNSVPRGNVGRDENNESFGYVAVPVEQTTALVYSPATIAPTSTFTNTTPKGTLPIFSVDLSQRGADIEQVVSLLTSGPIAYTNSAISPVSIQTTLDGPFYVTGTSPSLISDGLIPQVQSVSSTAAPNGSLLLITFKPPRPNSLTTREGFASVVVGTDQIVEIKFTQN